MSVARQSLCGPRWTRSATGRGPVKAATSWAATSMTGAPKTCGKHISSSPRRSRRWPIHKSDLNLPPIWHQKKERVHAHILVCFLAYVIWKTLARSCSASGLGDEPRKVFDEIAQIQMVDVVLPTKSGIDIRRRCVARPTKHQAILLQHLRLNLPTNLKAAQNVAQTSQAQTANPRSKSALLPG